MQRNILRIKNLLILMGKITIGKMLSAYFLTDPDGVFLTVSSSVVMLKLD